MAPDLNIVIVGVGNDFRTDDGVGPAVARYIADMDLPGVRIIDQVGDGTDLINAWTGADAAFVVDCMRSGSEPGTIRRFDVLRDDLAEEILPGLSTHAFNVGETVRLARSIGQLPRTLIVYGVEGCEYSLGDRLTSPVEKAVVSVAEKIGHEIALLNRPTTTSEAGG